MPNFFQRIYHYFDRDARILNKYTDSNDGLWLIFHRNIFKITNSMTDPKIKLECDINNFSDWAILHKDETHRRIIDDEFELLTIVKVKRGEIPSGIAANGTVLAADTRAQASNANITIDANASAREFLVANYKIHRRRCYVIKEKGDLINCQYKKKNWKHLNK
jgi:hypothetical protein